MAWVAQLGARAGDQYRRVYSRDVLVVSAEDLRQLPSSAGGVNRFIDSEAVPPCWTGRAVSSDKVLCLKCGRGSLPGDRP